MKFDIQYFLSAKYAKWIIISLITLFSFLIFITYFGLFFSTYNEGAEVNQSGPAKVAKQDFFSAILDSSLFGVYVPDGLNEDNVKKSMLDLTLVGIMLADTVEDSQVIIRSASGDEKTYKIGDKVPGNALIKRIMAGGVLVEHNGALESLSLPKNDLTFEPVPKPLKEE